MVYMTRLARREAIIAAASAVMLKDGFDAMTTRRVAAEMGAANGIIHHHFKTASELKCAAFRYYEAAARAEFVKMRPTLGATSALKLFVSDHTDDARESGMRFWAEAWRAAQADIALAGAYTEAVSCWHRLLCGIIADGVAGGEFRTGAVPETIAWRILGLGIGLSSMAVLPVPLLSPPAVRNLMMQAVADDLGIAPPEMTAAP
ncbi:TetR family transcriptional regulator C-terminal domain-containing protein [Ensifer sp. HO-A22]|uniref:TetR family transcriptional regulator C-terminal domain-containing protein n=1 Tax=Ensifer oleiphilus TaxID=2742698 RepID=A0A7Y6UPE3_9HYPH|nr:TetR family transcriptional regulator C-terminal domain-containing protein [Ensifer oleiphilus]NVD41147.1 TetR family transcriptional regulator C-terminal domain-containing protein [Ensifer oleiphilus]